MNNGNSSTGTQLGPSPLGVYVHFPFCLKKCPYCDFVSFRAPRETLPHEAYAEAILRELSLRLDKMTIDPASRTLSTIFFGGGTPSLWSSAAIGQVVSAIRAAFPRQVEEVEVTVECNPTSLDEDKARSLLDVGVNRLSIGVQALDDERLEFLGRLHRSGDGLRAIEDALRAGMPRVSGDLIFGVATERTIEPPEVAAEEARRVARTGVSHVSAYALTIEPNTEFGALAKKGRLPQAPEDSVIDSLFAVETALEAEGFGHYEISNYARPGQESRHNLGYWRGFDYLGLGTGAVGTISEGERSVRYRNATDPRKYMDARSLEETTGSEEELTAKDRMNERIMLGLRLAAGLDLEEAARDLGIAAFPPEREKALKRLVASGRVVQEGSWLRVPAEKRNLVDGTAAALFV